MIDKGLTNAVGEPAEIVGAALDGTGSDGQKTAKRQLSDDEEDTAHQNKITALDSTDSDTSDATLQGESDGADDMEL